MNSLAGTRALVGFIVRRHWLRILIWVASIALMVLATAASVEGLYPTQASLDQAAAATKDNAAAIVFNGPAQALDTRGGQVVFQVGAFGLVVVGLMSVMMIGALTRGEEESGRMEMIRSLPVGRHAPQVAAFIVVAAMSIIIGGLVTASLVPLGLAVVGSLTFGLCFALTGLLFAGVASAAVQLSENTRVAYGMGGAALGVAFALRAVGDVTDGTLSWASPIGLVQKSRPFADETWLPLALAALLTATMFAVGAVLSARRDLGAGLWPSRAGPPRAGRLLGSVEGLALRLHRGAVLGWTVGVAFTGIAYGSIGDSVEDFIADNEAMLEMIARAGNDIDLTSSFLATSLQLLCLLGAAYGVQVVLRVRSEETGLQAEPLLATPVSRERWLLSHVLVATLGAVVVLVVGGAAVGLSYALVTGDTSRTPDMLKAAVTYVPAVWVLIGIAVVCVGRFPRSSALAWTGPALVFILAMFGELLGVPQWLANVSPVDHVPLVPAAAFSWTPICLLTAVALVLFGAGFASLARRDIG